MEWYLTISHPYIIPHVVGSSDVGEPYNVRVSDAEGQADEVPPPQPPLDTDNHERLQMVVVIVDNLMNFLNLDGEVLTILSQVALIARGGLFRFLIW